MPKELILKWNLDHILPIREFDSLFREIELDIAKLQTFTKKLSPDMPAAEFAKFVKFEEMILEKVMKLYDMPSLMESADEKSERAKYLKNRAKDLYLKLQDEKRSIDHWIKGKDIFGLRILDDANAKRLFSAIPDLEYTLLHKRESAKFTLTEREEKIISEKSANGEDVLTDLRELLETEFRFSFKPYRKKPAKLIKTRGELMAHVSSNKPELRREAYRSLMSKYHENLDKFFMIYQAVVKNWANEAKLRGFKSSISMRNFSNDIPDRAIEVLLDVCKENNHIFQNYFRWKAKQLGLKKLTRFDIYAPIARHETKTSFRDAIDIVLKTYKEFSPKFAEAASRVISERHIDSHPRPGKRDGAFCSTITPKITPYVLINYLGRVRDVSTLAHELGHAVHSILANRHSISSQHANIPLAETASTLGELILFEKLLAKETDPAVKRSMLSDKISESYATITRQNYFVKFEIKAHEEIMKGITSEKLSDIWLNGLREQFGSAVEVDPIFKYEWANIPHIVNTPFYCYAYNFGELLSLSLFKRYKQRGHSYAEKIEKMLSYGGSKNPVAILEEIGIDITSAEFWREGFEVIEDWQAELESI